MSSSSPVPSTTPAVVITGKGSCAIKEVPVPSVADQPDRVLVRVTAVALNPTDWKHVEWAMGGDPTGARVGCDYAGVVEEVGSGVTKGFKKGDRIAGVTHGSNQSNHNDGAFAHYIAVKGDVQIATPPGLSDTDAATLGIGISTVGQGLYRSLGLPLPDPKATTNSSSSEQDQKKEKKTILIYGGSTATGVLGIQFAKLSGLRVLATASPRNFAYLRSLGADDVFDYGEAGVGARIREASGGGVDYAWDCAPTAQTAAICAEAFSPERGGKYAALLPGTGDAVKRVNGKVSTDSTLMYTIFGETFQKGFTAEADEAEFEFAKKFWELSRELLEGGKLRAVRTEVNRGGKKGLEGVLEGLKILKEGGVSGAKLVYTLP